MEENSFFKWTSRINSILFLVLLLLSIGVMLYATFESNRWSQRHTVEVTDEKNKQEKVDELRLSDITRVCGKDVQYVLLSSDSESSGFSSGGGYGNVTRNIIFFVGKDMDSHWLYDTNSYLIDRIDQLKKSADSCKEKETVAIYYEIRKQDTNSDGKLDEQDTLTVALTTPDGHNYTEIETGITSVLDHSINADASELTLLAQYESLLMMKKYALPSNEKISEKEITRIGKKL